jgi:hypothetical protein
MATAPETTKGTTMTYDRFITLAFYTLGSILFLLLILGHFGVGTAAV